MVILNKIREMYNILVINKLEFRINLTLVLPLHSSDVLYNEIKKFK